ncbi:MAG: hypothetical protein ACE5EQ_02315 [Phycisphaerae bacterium]
MTERSTTAARLTLVCMCICALAFAGVLVSTANAAPPVAPTAKVSKQLPYGQALDRAEFSTTNIAPAKGLAVPSDGTPGSIERGPGVVVSQLPNQSNGIFSDADCDFCGTPPTAQVLAEDFNLFGGATITSIRLWVGFFPDDLDPTDNMTVIFHNDDGGGLPGTVVGAVQSNAPTTRVSTGGVLFGVSEWEMTIDIADVTLTAGTYHVEIYNNTTTSTDSMFWEAGDMDAALGIMGQSFAFEAPGSTWMRDGATDMAYELIGTADAVLGACCDTSTGVCTDGVDILACADQFTANEVCANVSCQVSTNGSDNCDGAPLVNIGDVNSGDTTGATVDDTFFACGTSITAPGVWYRVIGNGNQLTATTCTSFFGYDTKLTVFCACTDASEFWNCVGGNDDNCSGGGSGLLSTVTWCSEAGKEYRILVHGFSSGEGQFELVVQDGAPCGNPPSCAAPAPPCEAFPNATPENEPNCGLPIGTDDTNGGCNSDPNVFSPIVCGETYCGTAGNDGNGRDTDWYLLDMGQPGTVTWEVETSFPGLIAILTGPCDGFDIPAIATTDAGVPLAISAPVQAGNVMLFAATAGFSGTPCGAEYRASLSADVVCEAGACCNPDGTCSEPVAEADCIASGGAYQGNGTDCSGEPGPFVCGVDGAPDATLTVEVHTDAFPGETSWELVEQTSGVVASDGPFASADTTFTQDVAICNASCYDFTIFDAFGDGICCGFGMGFYNLLLDGTLIATGGDFGSDETVANIGGCGGGAPVGCNPADADGTITIDVLTDDFPGETSWELVEQGIGVVAMAGPFANPGVHEITNVAVCSTACYDFTIFDAFGDGICCGFGMGSYTVSFNGMVVGSGGEFGADETVANIGDGCAGGSVPCSPELVDGLLTILVHTDDFPGETSWELDENNVGIVASAGPFVNPDADEITDVEVCSSSCYTWTIFDAFGDGICCGFGMGFYTLTLNGVEIASGGDFGDMDVVAQIGPVESCGLLLPFNGACCIGGTCVDTTEDCCANVGGTFNGFGTFCSLEPTISCPADTTVECDGAGNTAELLAFLNSVSHSSGVCGDVSLSTGFDGTPGCGATGSTLVTFTVTDNTNGLSASCSATFTIEDTTAPTVTCSATSTTDQSSDGSQDSQDGLEGDDHPGGSQSGSRNSGGSNADNNGGGSPPGNLLLEFGATDVCGAVSVSAAITVGCPGIEFGCLIIPVIDGQIIDLECSDPNGDDQDCEFENDEGTLKIHAGSAMMIVTATDDCGNTSTCTVDLCAAIPAAGGNSGGSMRSR